MFIIEEKRKGSCYYEFQYCKLDNPVKNNKVNVNVIHFWQADSLLLSDADFADFYSSYSSVFHCALLGNGKTGFDSFGPNYYDKKNAEKILHQAENILDVKYNCLLKWLQKAVKEYNGFYILGI